LSCADSYGIELEVQTTGVEPSVIELLEPWYLSLFNKRVMEDEARATKALQLSCKCKSGRVAENALTRLETNTDNEDARTGRASSTSSTAAVKLFCQSGRAVAHEFGSTLEDRQVGVVGEEVEGVNRNAVTTNTKTGTESLVAIRFCCGSIDHLIGVNAVSTCGIGHLIDIGNVDHTVAVLEELGHLSHFRLADGNDLIEDTSVQLVDDRVGCRCKCRDDFGNLLGSGEGATGVNTFRRHATVENVLVRTKNLASSADLNTALNDDGIARLNVLQDHGQSADQMAQVDSVVSLEQSRD